MANLIAGKRLVPELIQNDFTASNIVRELSPLLPDGPSRESMMMGLAGLRSILRAKAPRWPQETGSAIARVAQITLELLGKTHQAAIAEAVAPETMPY
jgi:lipid-A-disaccharide synthase